MLLVSQFTTSTVCCSSKYNHYLILERPHHDYLCSSPCCQVSFNTSRDFQRFITHNTRWSLDGTVKVMFSLAPWAVNFITNIFPYRKRRQVYRLRPFSPLTDFSQSVIKIMTLEKSDFPAEIFQFSEWGKHSNLALR